VNYQTEENRRQANERSMCHRGLWTCMTIICTKLLNDYNLDINIVFVKLWGENPGAPMTYSNVYATFKELERKTGIHITPHNFRHTHGTIFYLQTKNIKAVQERLGHSQIQMTINLYVHPSEDDIRKDWEKAAHAFEIGHLYNHSELKERISFLRNQQEKGFVDSRIKREENNQNAVIASLKRRIEKLEQKNKQLEEENIKLREKENTKLTEYFTKL
jgi:hypothetical protein